MEMASRFLGRIPQLLVGIPRLVWPGLNQTHHTQLVDYSYASYEKGWRGGPANPTHAETVFSSVGLPNLFRFTFCARMTICALEFGDIAEIEWMLECAGALMAVGALEPR